MVQDILSDYEEGPPVSNWSGHYWPISVKLEASPPNSRRQVVVVVITDLNTRERPNGAKYSN